MSLGPGDDPRPVMWPPGAALSPEGALTVPGFGELAVGEAFEGEGGEVPLPGCCVVKPTRSGLPYVDGFGQSGLTIRQARAPGINRNEGDLASTSISRCS